MNRIPISLALIPALLLALAGCGGGGHSGSSDVQDALIGTWSGTYRAASGAPAGTVTVTFARDPAASGDSAGLKATGTAQDVSDGGATVTGFVYDESRLDGTAVGSGILLSYAAGGYDGFLGRPLVNSQGHLVGPLVHIVGDAREPVTLDLTRTPSQ